MKTKICHIATGVTGKADGIYCHLKMIFSLCHKEYQHILIYSGSSDIHEELERLGVKVFYLPDLIKKIPAKAISKLFCIIIKEKVQIIHSHAVRPYLISGLINIFLKRKLIFNYHGVFINSIYYNRFEKALLYLLHWVINILHSVDSVIVPSYGCKTRLLQVVKFSCDIKVYYNGYYKEKNLMIDDRLLDFIKRLKRDKIIIGIIARMEIQKRIDLALLLARDLLELKSDLHFVFMGDGPLMNEMVNLSEELHIDQNVSILGYIPGAKLYIKYFDFILFTSDWEGLPLTIWEAMDSGTPIVSTKTGGIEEIIEVEKCGLTFKKDDIYDGIEKCWKLINNDSLRGEFGINGQKVINDKYTSRNFQKFINKIYESFIN